MKPKFISQAAAKGHPEDKLEKYGKIGKPLLNAFNKSHSTCYAWIAYQTAYLKAITLLNIWLRYCQYE
jgi:DNA polymerase-3 subunit alpha